MSAFDIMFKKNAFGILITGYADKFTLPGPG
jgi:hypothetical protein